jgi:hypothetical protein
VYLSREDRIKGHIAVCFLAFFLQVTFLRIVRGEEKLKELSARSMLQELSEVRMVHLKAGEAEYRIRTELSPAANAIFQAAEVPFPVASTRPLTANYSWKYNETSKIRANKSTTYKTPCQR